MRHLPRWKQLLLRGKPCRVRAVAQAKLYVDVKEHPPGSNHGPEIDRWCLWANGIPGGYPWCAAFVCAMVREACGLILPEPKRASVGFLEEWAGKNGELLPKGIRPRRGDLVCYRFDADNWPDHIGFVDRVLSLPRQPLYLRTVEGNTSAGNDANGGQVQVRYRRVDNRCRFVRLNAKKLQPVAT